MSGKVTLGKGGAIEELPSYKDIALARFPEKVSLSIPEFTFVMKGHQSG